MTHPTPFWAADNTAFFTEKLPGRDTPLGSPGGAEPAGQVGTDTPLVAGWVKT